MDARHLGWRAEQPDLFADRPVSFDRGFGEIGLPAGACGRVANWHGTRTDHRSAGAAHREDPALRPDRADQDEGRCIVTPGAINKANRAPVEATQRADADLSPVTLRANQDRPSRMRAQGSPGAGPPRSTHERAGASHLSL